MRIRWGIGEWPDSITIPCGKYISGNLVRNCNKVNLHAPRAGKTQPKPRERATLVNVRAAAHSRVTASGVRLLCHPAVLSLDRSTGLTVGVANSGLSPLVVALWNPRQQLFGRLQIIAFLSSSQVLSAAVAESTWPLACRARLASGLIRTARGGLRTDDLRNLYRSCLASHAMRKKLANKGRKYNRNNDNSSDPILHFASLVLFCNAAPSAAPRFDRGLSTCAGLVALHVLGLAAGALLLRHRRTGAAIATARDAWRITSDQARSLPNAISNA